MYGRYLVFSSSLISSLVYEPTYRGTYKYWLTGVIHRQHVSRHQASRRRRPRSRMLNSISLHGRFCSRHSWRGSFGTSHSCSSSRLSFGSFLVLSRTPERVRSLRSLNWCPSLTYWHTKLTERLEDVPRSCVCNLESRPLLAKSMPQRFNTSAMAHTRTKLLLSEKRWRGEKKKK